MKKFTIIGSGATGTLLAVNLIKNAGNKPFEINLVEKNERIGRGVAYSAAQDFHLLNVPANKMGAFPDDIEHFYKWLTAKDYDFFASDFVPRKFYGEYLRETFCEALKNKNPNVSVNLIDDEAVDILVDETQAQVILNSGEILYSDKIILAFGNFPPPHPKSENQSFTKSEKYFQNPWSAEILYKIEPRDDVFVIGTGLTAIDTALTLHHKQHRGKIFLFSTRGLLPSVHELGYIYPSFEEELKTKTRITDLLKIVRQHIKKAEKQNSNWRAVIDSLRPHTQAIWLSLPVAEKRYFMQHLSRYWNVARHRMPPECAKILD
ncbi:MAG: FAD/NAD(P)-binding protein, partial [Acidobacteria bacterium]|nr:FAD/NAD(P)-binding protein [Acidobacteriota bacterium]